jgi:hypothetical protein
MSTVKEEDINPLKSWESDRRLKDPRWIPRILKIVKITEDNEALVEQLPDGPMKIPKEKSVPILWETVKD